MEIFTQLKERTSPGIENILNIIEGAPRMDLFLEKIPYPKKKLKNSEIKISDLRLIKLRERGMIGKPKASVFFSDEPKLPAFFTASSPYETRELKEGQCGSALDLIAEKAKMRSMAEGVERFCLRNLHKRIFGNFKELSKNYKLEKPEMFGIDEKTKFSWTEVFKANTKEKNYIPSQFIYVPSDFSDFFKKEPLIKIPTSNGAAYGDSYETATYNGLLEIVERDATIISWLAKRDIPKLELNTPTTESLEKYFRKYNLKLNVFDVTTDLNVPVMMTLIKDETGFGPYISVGAGSSLNPEKATIKSILEAQQGRMWIRSSYLIEGKPKINPSDIVDMKTRAFYWYDEKKSPGLDFLMKSEDKKKLSLINNVEGKSPKDNLKIIADKLLKKDYNLFIADISTKDVKEVGSRVVKVICPELQPFYLNENYPVYSKRLRDYLKGSINKIPHPII